MKYKDYYTYLNENSANNTNYIKVLAARALKRFPHAATHAVYSYCLSNVDGVTIKQLEDDSKTHKWDEDTTKAIYYVMSRKKLNRTTKK